MELMELMEFCRHACTFSTAGASTLWAFRAVSHDAQILELFLLATSVNEVEAILRPGNYLGVAAP